MIDLAEMLIERAPVPMSKVFFANSGSEANDSAIKMVWYLNNSLGRPNKKKDHRAAEGISRHYDWLGVLDRAASQSPQLRPAAAWLRPHGNTASLSRRKLR
jgi:4-aminobutyrate aminotransferase-like enzyme